MGDVVGAEEYWMQDKLNRKEDAKYLLDFLAKRYQERRNQGKGGSYVLNVDAGWGRGKTFFLRGMYEQTLTRKHPAVFIDAWASEVTDDPYAAFVSEIEAYLSPILASTDDRKAAKAKDFLGAAVRNFGAMGIAASKGLVRRGAEKLIGNAVDDLVEIVTDALSGDGVADEAGAAAVEEAGKAVREAIDLVDEQAKRLIAEYRVAQKSRADFRTNLQAAIEAFAAMTDAKLPFIIFIDELDRCKPPYAIAMLERIKHLFDVDGIAFVLATDTAQLAHSICAVYGAEFDGRKYLQRFFARTFRLPDPDMRAFVGALLAHRSDRDRWAVPGDDKDPATFLALMSQALGMRLRDAEQCIELLLDITTSWDQEFPIELVVIYPMIFAHMEGLDHDLDPPRRDPLWPAASRRLSEKPGMHVYFDRTATEIHSIFGQFQTFLGEPRSRIVADSAASHRRSGSHQVAYVLEAIQREFDIRDPSGGDPEIRPFVRRYPDIINHAYFRP